MISYENRVINILVYPEKCVGCLICQFRCSIRLTKSFNPARAAIIINLARDRLGAEITFTHECDLCGICARNCPYGALEIRRKEVSKDDEN